MADVKISALPAAGAITGAELVPVVQGGVTSKTTTSTLARPYKVYTFALTQSGSSDPVATVFENTLGVVPVWARSSAGIYTIQSIGAFTVLKCYQTIDSVMHDLVGVACITHNSGDAMTVQTKTGGSLTDGLLNVTCGEIRVYP